MNECPFERCGTQAVTIFADQLFTNCPKRSSARENLSPAAAKPMRKCDGDVKTVAGGEQDSALRGGLAEGTSILAADHPGERSHAALWRNPAENVGMFLHELIQNVSDCAWRLPAFVRGRWRASGWRFRRGSHPWSSCRRRSSARGPVLLAALGVVLDHPAGAYARESRRPSRDR